MWVGIMGNQEKVYIVLLNWNGWRETIKCLESIFRLNYPTFDIVLVDNNSSDDSVKNINSWVKGNFDLNVFSQDPLKTFFFPPVDKPVSCFWSEHLTDYKLDPRKHNLIMICAGSNLGYAGGINVGLRKILEIGDMKYVWILNNDTVVKPDSLQKLVQRIQMEGEMVGICGSSVYYYDSPSTVQTHGGIKYNKWLGITTFLNNKNKERAWIENQMDAVYGASMFVSNKFIKTVGLLSEEYFLYYEEIDWTIRGNKKGFKSCFAPQSVIFHYGGRSTKASERNPNNKSLSSDFYFLRNRILLTRKFYPFALPTIYFSLIISLLNRVRRGQFKQVIMILKIIFGKI